MPDLDPKLADYDQTQQSLVEPAMAQPGDYETPRLTFAGNLRDLLGKSGPFNDNGNPIQRKRT